ncbi:MAG: cob(I)yrinic acid a,c-diamide adenosyltransferase [Candidatus Helarchaeota archaeon]
MPRRRLERGLIQIYFGSAKGKTTCALGQGFRAVGHGFKVYMIQFMKGEIKYGEINSIKKTDNFWVKQFGRKELIAEADDFDLEEGKKALSFAKEIIMSDEYDIVILDEVGYAVYMNIIDVDELIDIIKNRPPKVEIIITGRKVHPKLKIIADLITEMRLIKHYYVTQGIKARFGIEY